LSAPLRYGAAILTVAAALGLALLLDRYGVHDVEFPLFLFAIALNVWFGGVGPGVITLILSATAFNYFFTEPFYSFYIARTDVPFYLSFILFAALLTWFSAVRRRVERDLRQSRDELENEVRQRRALNEELGKRSAELQAINKELEAFAYSVSHDLRAPIRHIAGFTELLQKNSAAVLDERSQRHTTMILEAAKKMGNLIDDLLAFSRIGRAEAHKTMVSLQQLVQEAQSEVAQETDGRDINWKVGELPACYGDRSMLRLALINLIANAVKFTRTRPQAEIEIASATQSPDQIVVFVRDNGVGFDMKYVNKLFGVFQRLHAPEAFEGTGIGLATVQRIIHRHGGKVWAEGLVDGGATFYFSLSQAQGV
jgi:light-regulated signal transduction histidine kinase (bacteriophytochrome)